MRETFHSKVAFRAAQLKGGAAALARHLGASVDEVRAWMRSEAAIPDHFLLPLLDIISEDTVRQLRESGRGDPSESGNLQS